jgi:hypothetical protein
LMVARRVTRELINFAREACCTSIKT